MSTVIQVTFDPAKWAAGVNGAGTSYGCNGYDASSVVLDHDGVTAWAFETPSVGGFAAGFARFSLSTGSIVHQDAIFNQPGATPSLGFAYAKGTTGNVFWCQDDAGHYYTPIQNTGTFTTEIYKFHIAAGPAANLLNGYCVVDVTLGGGSLFARFIQDMTVWTNGGVHYLAWVDSHSSSKMVVINADTMALVGTYTPSPANKGRSVFVDPSNVLWAVFNTGFADSTCLVRWNPSDGATATILNVTNNTVTDATVGFTGVLTGTYVPANNSVLLSGTGTFTAPVATLDLTAFTQTAFHADDQTLLYVYELGPQLSAFDSGVQGGAVAISGDIISGGSPSLAQFGGILNIIDPVALTLSSSVNITAAINASAVANPVPLVDLSGAGRGSSSTPPFGTMAYSAASSTMVVTYETTPSISPIIGSPVYLIIPPLTLVSIAITPTSATIVVGGTQSYVAIGTYSDASTADITSTVTWASSVPADATIASGGLATGIAAGSTNITASKTA